MQDGDERMWVSDSDGMEEKIDREESTERSKVVREKAENVG